MKKDIHPKYFPKAKITCGCGHTFSFGDTKEDLKVDICSHCHPFYTGSQQLIDTAGRVERFKVRQSKIQPKKEKKVVKKTTEKQAVKKVVEKSHKMHATKSK